MLLNGVDLTITSVSLGADEVCGTRSGRSCADYVGYNLQRKTDGAVDASSTADLNLMAISLGDKALTPGQTQWVSFEYTGVLGAWPTSTEGLLQSAPFSSLDDDTAAGLDRTKLQVGWLFVGPMAGVGALAVRAVSEVGGVATAGKVGWGTCGLRLGPLIRPGRGPKF